ncbi:hypothetical protein APHAL10511_004093 [Amanita phalloides]|nr:hypothetical protein APHAL10511_004093 [Amanita phalloides]
MIFFRSHLAFLVLFLTALQAVLAVPVPGALLSSEQPIPEDAQPSLPKPDVQHATEVPEHQPVGEDTHEDNEFLLPKPGIQPQSAAKKPIRDRVMTTVKKVKQKVSSKPGPEQ